MVCFVVGLTVLRKRVAYRSWITPFVLVGEVLINFGRQKIAKRLRVIDTAHFWSRVRGKDKVKSALKSNGIPLLSLLVSSRS